VREQVPYPYKTKGRIKALASSMQQSPCEPDNYSAIQEIPRLLWQQKVHYCVHKSPPLVSTQLDESNPHLHALFSKVYFSIFLSCVPLFPKRSLSLSLCMCFPPKFYNHFSFT